MDIVSLVLGVLPALFFALAAVYCALRRNGWLAVLAGLVAVSFVGDAIQALGSQWVPAIWIDNVLGLAIAMAVAVLIYAGRSPEKPTAYWHYFGGVVLTALLSYWATTKIIEQAHDDSLRPVAAVVVMGLLTLWLGWRAMRREDVIARRHLHVVKDDRD